MSSTTARTTSRRSSARAGRTSPTRCGCLKLPEPVKALVRSGKLSAGHARLLVGQPNAQELAELAIGERLERAPARGVGAQGRRRAGDATMDAMLKKSRAAAPARMPTRARWRSGVSDALGLDVTVDHRGEGGTLHIKYRDLDQLDEVLRKLGG